MKCRLPANTGGEAQVGGALPVHGVGLVPAVGDGVEQVAHAGVLRALLGRAEVVVRHLVDDVVGDSSASVGNPVGRTSIVK